TPATGHRCQAQAPREEQLRLPTTSPRLAPSCCSPPQSPSFRWIEVSPRVIVAKPRPRRSSSDFTLHDPSPQVNQEGINAPAACSNRTVASAATPSDR
ncbi:hypothetical protein PVAP13_9NG726577, partial [Panicum virgatum]